ncbi:hypothetical protein BH11PSE3_BH11PSE3_04730 [soil metagenome]
MKRALRILAIVVGSLVGLLALLFGALQTPPGQRAVASLVSGAASTAEGGLELSGLSGFFPTNLQVARIAYRDREGPWLTVENLRLRWSFAALLAGRLQIEDLSADRVSVLRPPLPDKQPAKPGNGTRLQLPVGIDLQRLAIQDLYLAAALARAESHWHVEGTALLPADLEQGRLILNAERSDGKQGNLAANINFDAVHRTVSGEISLAETEAGVLAALLERPDAENLSVRLAVKGDAHAGTAELNMSAGDVANAKGKALWEPKDGATAVSVKLDAAGPGLPKGPMADVVRQPIVLSVQAVVGDKLVTVSEATLKAATLNFAATARYDRVADRLEATANARADEPGALGPLAGGATWKGLHLEAKADIATLATEPKGTIVLTGGGDEISLTALDARLPPVGNATLAATLDVGDGKITARSFDLGSPLATAKGDGSYVPATEVGALKATVVLPSLAPLSTLAGTPLAGAATVEVAATSDKDGVKGTWKGIVSDVGARGLAAEAVTAKISLSGGASWRFDEAWSLSDVRIASDGGALGISGEGKAATGVLDLSLDLPKLGMLQADLGGAAKITGKIRMRGDGTDVKVAATLSGLERGQLKASELSLAASATLDAAGAVSGEAKASGDLAGHPLSLDGRFARDPAGGISVPSFKGRWASAALDVNDLTVTAARTSGYAHLKVDRLQDASVLAGVPLGGALDAEITADERAANGRVTVRVTGAELRTGALAIGALDFRSTIDEPMTRGVTDATLAASRIVGAADMNRLNATASGDRLGLVITVQASGGQTTAAGTAKVALAGQDILVGLTRFDARYLGIPVALTAPTRIVVAGERISIEPTNLRVGGGRLSARGTIAPTGSDLQVEIAAMPLALIDAVAPGTNLDGSLQAKLRMTGASSAPLIDATYSVAGLKMRRPDAALIPPLSVQGTGSVMGRQASIDARLGAARGTGLTLAGKVTLPAGAAPLSCSAAIAGSIDIAPFAPLLGNDIRNITGTLRPNLTIEILGPRVTGTGSIDFSNGAVALPVSGLRLSGGEGRLVLQGDTIQVQKLAFQTGRGGGLSATGTLRLDAQQGVLPDLTVTSRNALLVSRPDLVATVSSNLKITGSSVSGIDVSGPITVDRADITVGGQQSASFPTFEVREINKAGAAPQAPPPVQAAGAAKRAPPPPDATPIRLALSIRAPQAVFVRGRGIDAEMSGQVEVSGTPFAPSVAGGLTLRRGEFTLLGRRLNFSRGIVTLDNLDAIDPRLDFVASTSVHSTTINVAITGTARDPVIAVTSVPQLPADEAMALLLFGKPASGLSVFELAQAAQGLAELTGQASGTGALGRLRNSLGLDRLSVGSGTGSNASSVSVEAGRYVAPGVYVGARQGATGNSSRGVVQFEVLDNVKIEGDIGADSNGRVGVKMEWDY